jgi:hypothetical protein
VTGGKPRAGDSFRSVCSHRHAAPTACGATLLGFNLNSDGAGLWLKETLPTIECDEASTRAQA